MKRFIAFLIVLIAIAVVGGMMFMSFKQKLIEQQLLVARADIGQQLMERIAFSKMLPAGDYADDIGVVLSGYGRDLAKLYQNPDFALLRDPDSVRKIYDEEHLKGRKDDRTWQQVNQRIDYTQEVMKELLGGSYKPMVTAQADGLRLDIYDISKAPVDGQDRLMVKVMIIGGDPEGLSFGHIEMKMKIEGEVEKKVRGETVMEKVTKLAKVEGGGSPNTLIKTPRKWVEDFPPGIMIGFYDFPLFPPSADELSLSMGFAVRTAGGHNLMPQLEFSTLPISPGWRLPEGASWEAEEVEATEEEAKEFMGKQ